MSSNSFAPNGLPTPSGGLAARRGSQNPKPLAVDVISQPQDRDCGVPTPRTSRSHLLAGLRTAPKSATAASFGPQSPTTGPQQQYARNSMAGNAYGMGQDKTYNAPKTAHPYGSQSNYNQSVNQHYTVDQILSPPELSEEHDPNLYSQLLATNLYLAQQQQRLQQQLMTVQSAAQQFQQLNLSNPQLIQQQRQQQQQVQATQLYNEQPSTPGFSGFQQHLQQHHQGTPSVQVSPPAESQPFSFRSNSPPKRYESPTEVAPLPPPSANAFRRGHKKASSLAPVNSAIAAAMASDAAPKSAGPKTSTFPMTPMTGGYGPGQARAGEHPIRQPRGPPSLDELKQKPTAKYEGSKNFSARTRRSAVSNLVRAGLERRKGTGSSCGSMSPVSETAEESSTPITDNESDSGRSGSGSLAGDMECPSSRTSASGSWGAIGSDRPSSRQKTRKSVDSIDSVSSNGESETNSFADVFKNGALRAAKAQDSADNQRKAHRRVFTKSTPSA
uniref:WGS project CBMF000000000 data, contig CS5834_c000249 n=2 Tax=Fusarium pseudograminearum TaxID=101028 RepID=A0A096PDQ1_FUSPS|nr:unnamed protein product [Fusarium pseudograminearum CS3427]CEG03195.1 unnamed protein product [Fusarium pseudograminearum CS5834]